MIQTISISKKEYSIPAVLHLPDETTAPFPAVILCHGTGSDKDEVGHMFMRLADLLANHGIASVRFDFAGCGDSEAPQQALTFFGEVDDTMAVYQMLSQYPTIDPQHIGILGFSQGARVMAEFLHCSSATDPLGTHQESRHVPHPMATAVSWSGACHDGPGVFAGWYPLYYEEAVQKGYATIPLDWREDLLLSREWFDEIRDTKPLDGFAAYPGPVLVIAGTDDPIVPCQHAQEILARCHHPESRSLVLPGADHTFCVLTEDQTLAEKVLQETMAWFCTHL